MAKNKTARLRAKLKRKQVRRRARVSGKMKVRTAGGRQKLVRTPTRTN